MKSFLSLFFLILTLSGALYLSGLKKDKPRSKKDFFAPYEWAGVIRNYPDIVPAKTAYLSEVKNISRQSSVMRSSSVASFNTPWRLEGPGNIGGRINCLEKDPSNPNVFYAGSASGGIWKTIDNCSTWLPVFDANSFLAISDIKVRQGNPDVIFAATGDENISGYMFVGDGIYRSNDAGATWINSGLSNTGIVSEIILHPQDSNIIYASAMGYPFAPDPNRGVYKSIDGGVTWNNILFVNDSTGIIDLVMDPVNPQILYATSWNRIRSNTRSLVYGPDAHVWRTLDGGLNWSIAVNGLPQTDMSRINLAVSATVSGRVFASYVNPSLELEGIFRSDDFGVNWTTINTSGISPGSMGGFGWYFGNIIVNPVNDNEIFFCAVDMYKTSNNGSTWTSAWMTSDPHADKHDIISLGGQHWLMATDGGIYRTTDGGVNWQDADNIPNNQFYRITYNPHTTGEYAGGVQDNGTNSGNHASLNNWTRMYGGDGFTIRYHPFDPNVIFVEYQNGEINYSMDGGMSYNDATTGIDFSDRRNWDMPYVFNPQNPDEMLTGTYRSYINSTGTNIFWIDGIQDLTDGVILEPRFHVISAVDWSPLNSDHLLIGTSDANVWFSNNKGNTWNQVNAGLPDRYISSVHFSPNTANRVFVTVTGYKDGINQPHVFRSDNNGLIWTNISGNLPNLAINDVLIMPGNDAIIFVATDGGVYGTTNAGTTWNRVGNNMPFVPVYDLDFEPVQRRLMAGTFGRSMYSVNVDTVLSTQGLQSLSLNTMVSVFPAITSSLVTVKGLSHSSEATLYSSNGARVMERNLQGVTSELNLSELPAGLYILTIICGREKGVWKIIRE